MAYIIGLDLGTSGLKGLLVNRQGEVLQTASATYPLLTPQPGFSEQNPEEWLKASQVVINKLIELEPKILSELVAISFSGQMHSLVLLDENKQVVRNEILWNDVRTTKECQRIMGEKGADILRITKNIALEGFTLPKILWVQEEEPATWEKVRSLMLPKDYLGFWLTGNQRMDYSDAAGTLLLDLEQKEWSKEIIEYFKIPLSYLPELSESSGKIGEMKEELRGLFGFEKKVAIFAGGADNACGAVAAGITREGIGMSSIGTSGVFLAFEETAQVDYQGKLHVFHHGIKDRVYSMGVTLAAGHSLTWFKNNFAKELSYPELLSTLNDVQPGADGLLFTPYIVGERTPHSDSHIRGSFIGLDTRHEVKHLVRGVIEGITFSLKASQELMNSHANKTFGKIVSVGGGAKNDQWLQIQADIFNTPIVTLKAEEGPGFGAVMIAAVGLGWFAEMTECSQAFVSYDRRFEPNPEAVLKYQTIFDIYKKVYGATKEISHELQRLRNKVKP